MILASSAFVTQTSWCAQQQISPGEHPSQVWSTERIDARSICRLRFDLRSGALRPFAVFVFGFMVGMVSSQATEFKLAYSTAFNPFCKGFERQAHVKSANPIPSRPTATLRFQKSSGLFASLTVLLGTQ